MTKFRIPRRSRIITGLVVVSVFAVAPVAAQALPPSATATGTLTAGALTNNAPASIGSLSTTLTGRNQTISPLVGAWKVTDATGSNAGYTVSVAASNPTDTGGTAGTGGSLTLTPTTATANASNPAATGPVATGAQLLSTTAVTIDTAAAGTGQGEWDFAADAVGSPSLAVVIPGDASAGTYTSTLTYTSAPLVVGP